MSSERKLAQRTHTRRFYLQEISRISKSRKPERLVVARDWKEEAGYRFPSGAMQML
jgi:hypothetical protein